MGLTRCGDNCNWTDYWNVDRQKMCRRKRDCVCKVCAPLEMYESCAGMCNTDDDDKRIRKIDDFWKKQNPEDVWRRYKVAMPGFDPTTTIEYQQNAAVQDRLDEENKNQGKTMNTLIYAVVGIVVLFILVKLLRG
jgi:hypothetical protein